MKKNISATVLVLTVLSSLSQASPAYQPRGYSEPVEEVPTISFPCGDDIPNWVIDVGFGTPKQPASLLIDTTFDATFVAGVMCHSEFCLDQSEPLYNAGKSSTSVSIHRNETFDLGDGEIVRGDLYKDVIDFGHFAFEDKIFGKAFEIEGFPSDPNFSGVFGMSKPNALASKTKRDPADFGGSFKQRLIKGHVKRNNDALTCSLDFGIDYSAISGEIAWLNLPTCEYGDSPFWKTDLTCVTVDDVVDLKFKNTIAEFDTTVNDIEVPHEDLQKIHQGLHATHDKSRNKYIFKCCDAKDLKISFAKYTVSIPPSSWTASEDGVGELCSARIAVSNTTIVPTNRWRLGTNFMLNFYTIFSNDMEQTGLALLKYGNEELKISSK